MCTGAQIHPGNWPYNVIRPQKPPHLRAFAPSPQYHGNPEMLCSPLWSKGLCFIHSLVIFDPRRGCQPGQPTCSESLSQAQFAATSCLCRLTHGELPAFPLCLSLAAPC